MPSAASQYWELTKPRVVALIVFTAIVGMFLAIQPGQPLPWKAIVLGSLGIWLASASAAAINHLLDQRIDVLMARTQHRPLATGSLRPVQVLVFALVLGALEWLWTAWWLVQQRLALGQPWLRLAFILGLVAVLTVASALVFRSAALRARYGRAVPETRG